jgi:hypothetical protein
VTSPFGFAGRIGRGAYALGSLAAFFSQHLLVALLIGLGPAPKPLPWWFWVHPLWSVVRGDQPLEPSGQILVMIAALAATWVLVALAVRRAQSVRAAWMASLAVAPLFQLIPMVWFSIAPELGPEPKPPAPALEPSSRDAVLGLLAGAGLSVAAVALSTLVFRTYGWGLFFASPFVIGLTTAYIVNRRAEVSLGRTFSVTSLALCFASLALLAFALEGAICLLFAAPLIFGMAFIGCAFGRAVASSRRGPGTTLMSIAVIPMLLIGELAAPPRAGFESVESVEVNASPAAVWESVVHMGPIPDAPAIPFRWGLAYPMRGEIVGSGVGAIRTGVFSTGVAYERVTEWEPGRKLSFIVLSDPPTMRELSPYREVNAPHVRGYFRTRDARFSIDALPNGKTRLTLSTLHDLELAPGAYWTPFAQWAVHTNKTRVLNHFRQQAEAASLATD